jgi:hypothetical protein
LLVEEAEDDDLPDGNCGNENGIRFFSGWPSLVGGGLSSITRVLLGLADKVDSFGAENGDGPNGKFGNGNKFCFFSGGSIVRGGWLIIRVLLLGLGALDLSEDNEPNHILGNGNSRCFFWEDGSTI